jgi:hypothetical protein
MSAGSRLRKRRRAPCALALAVAVLALCGCETTAEKSAKLEHSAKHFKLTQKGLAITKQSTQVQVLDTSVVKSAEGSAATVTLHNRSARTLRSVPLAITVKDAAGRTAYQNNAAGLEGALVSLPSLAPHATITWVDDQLPAGVAAATVSAQAGEAQAISGPIPALTISGARVEQEPSSVLATGTIVNHSAIEQRALVVFAVLRHGARTIAAGRAVLPQLPARASMPFQVYFIGETRGGQLLLAAPPTTFR